MKFKTLEGSENIRFLNDKDWEYAYTEAFFGPFPCTGKHCAEHKPKVHMLMNTAPSGKSFRTRTPCKGEGCQICEAFNV